MSRSTYLGGGEILGEMGDNKPMMIYLMMRTRKMTVTTMRMMTERTIHQSMIQ